MSGTQKLFVGFGVVFVLWLAAIYLKHQSIEDDLLARSQAALTEGGYDWANVDIAGRRGLVTGTPPSAEAGESARALVAGLYGVHTANAEYDELDVVSPYLWMADTREEGVVRLTGVAPSAEAIADLVTSAEAAFPDAKVINEMRIAAGAPTGDWLGTAKLGITGVARLDSGFATLNDTNLMVEGITADAEAAARVDSFMAAAADGFQGGTNITVTTPVATPEPVIIPEEARVEIDRCQEQINAVMAGKTINFRTASAEVFPLPNPIILALSEVAKTCPTTRVRITGHTDSTGDAEANQTLSEARAQAVVNLLVDSGVPGVRLTSDGYGASRPIADNATPEGRQQNRRIEFTVFYAPPE